MINKLRYIKYYSKIVYSNWVQNNDTYAQHGEDNLIEVLLAEGVNSFIDIGANDGVLFSNSYKFAKQGARGICIEPSKQSYRKLKLNHLLHPKVKCIKGAVSDASGKLYLCDRGYESTLSEVSKTKLSNSYQVNSFTFDEILDQFPNFTKVDLLSVDVEGHEKEVFKGLTNTTFSAKVIILETDKHKTEELMKIESLASYRPVYHNGLNTILTHKETKLFKPKNIPKGFELIIN